MTFPRPLANEISQLFPRLSVKVSWIHSRARSAEVPTHGEVPLRDVRGVYVKCLFLTGSGERCNPLASPGPCLIGELCVVWSLLPCEPVYKLGQWQCQVRILYNLVVRVQHRDNTTKVTPSWRLGVYSDDLIPYKVTSNYSVSNWDELQADMFDLWLQLRFHNRIHNPSRTQNLLQ